MVVIADLDHRGLLPPGTHWADSLLELERFAFNSHRKRLLNGFFEGVHLLRSAGCRFVYLDGSFVTTKAFPEDFDACWDTTGVSIDMLDPIFGTFENGRAEQLSRFGGEFFPMKGIAKSPWTTFLEFFQTDKATGAAKGLVGLQLTELL